MHIYQNIAIKIHLDNFKLFLKKGGSFAKLELLEIITDYDDIGVMCKEMIDLFEKIQLKLNIIQLKVHVALSYFKTTDEKKLVNLLRILNKMQVNMHQIIIVKCFCSKAKAKSTLIRIN